MATKTKMCIRRGIATNQPTPAEVLGFKELDTGNIVLQFENAEVVMPGTWRLNRDLYVGDSIAAWWDADKRFHLEWGDEA